MAGYECALCGGEEQATLLITPLTGGETMAVGQGCMGVAFAGMLAGHLGVDADKLYDAAAELAKAAPVELVEPPAPNGKAPAAPAAKRPRGRPRKTTKSPPATHPAESTFVRVPHGTPDEDEKSGP